MATPAARPPTAPGTPSARQSRLREIALWWIPPSSDGGSPITGYELELSYEGLPHGFSPIPGSGAGTTSYTLDGTGVTGNLFNANAQVPGSIDDTGLRLSALVNARWRAATRTDGNVPTPRPRVLGTDRYLRRIQANGATSGANPNTVALDVTDVATGRSTIGGPVGPQDFPTDIEEHWAWAFQIIATGRPWGGFFLRDDTATTMGGTPQITGDEPYTIPWPFDQDYTVFASDLGLSMTSPNLAGAIRVIVYDPRRARVSGRPGDFRFDTALQLGVEYRARIRAINAAGKGDPSLWSEPFILGATRTHQALLPAATRQFVVWPGETTSYTVSAPGVPNKATAQVSVVAPRRGSRVYDGIRCEFGTCKSSGEFVPSADITNPVSYIAGGSSTLQWETFAHTEATAQVTVRAPTIAEARRVQAQPFMRITTILADASDVVFLGPVDRSKGSIQEEGANHTWLVSVIASTMVRLADKTNLVRAPVETATTDVASDRLYAADADLVTHLRTDVENGGARLFVDDRDWPPEPLRVESYASNPLTTLDVARSLGDALGRGWQIAPDGFFRPLLHGSHPAAVLNPFSERWMTNIRAVSALPPRNRRFGLSNAEDFTYGQSPELAPVARHGNNADLGVDASGNFTGVVLRQNDDNLDPNNGQVIVEKRWDGKLDGREVQFVRLLVYDPGGYGARYPLPAMVDPELVSVSVERTHRTMTRADGSVYTFQTAAVDEPGRDDAFTTYIDADALALTVRRTWALTPTHLERTGYLNPGTMTAADPSRSPWVANRVGGAYRSPRTRWRFVVRVVLADRVKAPFSVTWEAFTPLHQGQEVDIKGMPGPSGPMRVVRTRARVHNITEEGTIVQWSNTALQSAALEESMDGNEFWRDVRRKTDEHVDPGGF